MSKFDDLFNFDAGKNRENSLKYVADISNAFHAILAHSNRKRKCADVKHIRVYCAGKMSCGNSQLGPFNESFDFGNDQKLIWYIIIMPLKVHFFRHNLAMGF